MLLLLLPLLLLLLDTSAFPRDASITETRISACAGTAVQFNGTWKLMLVERAGMLRLPVVCIRAPTHPSSPHPVTVNATERNGMVVDQASQAHQTARGLPVLEVQECQTGGVGFQCRGQGSGREPSRKVYNLWQCV